MIVIESCPICNQQIQPFIKVTDFTVSKSLFGIESCDNCNFLITTPRPHDNDLGMYYESDSYISHNDSSDSLLDKIYKQARKINLNTKFHVIKKLGESKNDISLLDYGCGTGEFLKYCQSKNIKIYGVEPSAKARSLASNKLGIQVLETLSLSKESLDIITLWHVLEHVPDMDETLRKLLDVLKISGTMFIAVPNHESYDAQIFKEYWAAYDVPRHLWHFSKKAMTQLIQKNNAKLIGIVPMKLDAYYVSLLSTKYQKNKFTIGGILKALSTGLTSNIKAGKNNHSSLIYIIRKNDAS